MAEKKGVSKVVWIILFAIITVLLCYLFTVVYFFFISPYNIALKLGFWPFGNEASISKMYMDSVVQIRYKTIDENFEQVDVDVLGVNISKNGLIIAPLSEFKDYSSDVQISVFTNGGSAYKGEFVSKDSNRNLALIKCKNMNDSKKKIAIPYVGIGRLNNCDEGEKIIMLSLSTKARTLASKHAGGTIEENSLVHTASKTVDGQKGYDFTVSNGFIVDVGVDTLSGGAVFNRKGKLLGFSFGELLDVGVAYGEYFVQPVYGASDYAQKVQNGAYSNALVDAVCGFDRHEASDMITWAAEAGMNTFYFDNTWNTITDEISQFTYSSEKGIYLMKDFEYKDSKIAAGSVITGLKVGKVNIMTEWRCDLIDALYRVKAGEKVYLSYKTLGSDATNTLSFTV